MSADRKIIWCKQVTDLAREIASRDHVDPPTALDRAIYQLSIKTSERRETDKAALSQVRRDVALRGWQTRKAKVHA